MTSLRMSLQTPRHSRNGRDTVALRDGRTASQAQQYNIIYVVTGPCASYHAAATHLMSLTLPICPACVSPLTTPAA